MLQKLNLYYKRSKKEQALYDPEARSKFLKSFMKKLSGKFGKDCVNAYASGNVQRFKGCMDWINKKMIEECLAMKLPPTDNEDK